MVTKTVFTYNKDLSKHENFLKRKNHKIEKSIFIIFNFLETLETFMKDILTRP